MKSSSHKALTWDCFSLINLVESDTLKVNSPYILYFKKIQMSLEGNDRRLQQLEIEVEIQEMANRLLRQIQEYISNQDHNINSEEMNTAQFNFQTLIDSTNQHITTIRNEVRDFLDTFEDQIRESDTES